MADQTLQDLQSQYGGKWRSPGDWGGTSWHRAPRIDPIGQAVWSQDYGWQDAGQMKRMAKKGGDFSSLTPQFGDWEQYFMAKPEGTSDPELRRQHGSNWMDYFAGSDFFKQYAQHMGAGNEFGANMEANPWYNTYGPDSRWNWGNEQAGSMFDPSPYSWYTGI